MHRSIRQLIKKINKRINVVQIVFLKEMKKKQMKIQQTSIATLSQLFKKLNKKKKYIPKKK